MDEIVTLLIVMNSIAIQGDLIVNPFIDDTTSSIFICNGDENNQLVREVLEVSNVENIWISQWNCYNEPIPKASNSLIILIEIEPQDFRHFGKRRHSKKFDNKQLDCLFKSENIASQRVF